MIHAVQASNIWIQLSIVIRQLISAKCPALQVKTAYVNFVNHCYVDTEVEMKEIYTSPHIWRLFDNFLVDMSSVSLCQIERSRMHPLFSS